MAEIHTYHTWEGNIGELLAAVEGVKTGVVMLQCPKDICAPLQYKFPFPAGQTQAEALSNYGMPSCDHGERVLPE